MNELRSAIRQLRKHPGATLIAALVLTFGIGLVTLQFSMVNCLLLRPLPFGESHRLYLLERLDPESQRRLGFSIPELTELGTPLSSFEELAAFTDYEHFEITGPGLASLRYLGSEATANLLDVLRVSPRMGRWFLPEEDRRDSPRVVVLSHRVWQRDFGGDPDLLGRSLLLDGESATLVGVMPEGFRFPFNQDLWTNLHWTRQGASPIPIVRLRPGVSLAAAQAELNTLGPRWAERLPQLFLDEMRRRNPRLDAAAVDVLRQKILLDNLENYKVVQLKTLTEHVIGSDKWRVWGMLVLGVCILLIACGNVATLQCARASARLRELAVRAALGAGRARLIAQMLCESLLIAALGGVGGLLLSFWGGRLLSFYLAHQPDQPFWFRLVIDWRVIAFAVLALGFAGIASGLLPALRGSRLDLHAVLKNDAGAGSGLRIGRFNRWIVVGEIALALPLLLVAGAMVKTVTLAYASLPAHDPHEILTARVELASRAQDQVNVATLLKNLESLPGVKAAALSERIPGNPQGRTTLAEQVNHTAQSEGELVQVFQEIISPGYFRTLAGGLLQGRDFSFLDTAESGVAIVNKPFARKFWPGENPLGQRFGCPNDSREWFTVIGLAPDLRMQGLMARQSDGAGFYIPHSQLPLPSMTLFLRVEGDPVLVIRPLQEIVRRLGSNQSAHSIALLPAALAKAVGTLRVFAVFFLVFGVAALLLAGVGVAGLLSFTVSRRTREFGVRFALGATAGTVTRLVMRQAAGQLALGLGLGLLLAWGIAPFVLGRLSLAVSPFDPMVDAIVLFVMITSAICSVWLPARRAAKTDPMIALRAE